MFNPPPPPHTVHLHGLNYLKDAHFISIVPYIQRQRFLSQFTLFLNSLNKHLFPDVNVFCLWIMSRFSSLVIHGRSVIVHANFERECWHSNIQSCVMLSISSVNISNFSSAVRATEDRASHLSFMDSERAGFGGIFHDIITEGNSSANPTRGGSNYKLYITPKVKEPTKFRINYKIC
jgi:hypothetical protein